MLRIVLTASVVLAVAAPAQVVASGPTPASSPPPTGASPASCAPPHGPLLGITRIDGTRTLAGLAPRTLRPRPTPRVPLPLRADASGWAFSPGCDAVAVPVRRGRILLVDLERGRRTGSLTLGGRSAISPLAWPRPDRLTGLTGPYMDQRVATVSVPDGRVVASHPIGGRPWVVEATSLGLLAVAGPPDRIGTATLVLARAEGSLLRVPLTRIRTGYHTRPRATLAREVTPGLAVDEELGRAYVVAAGEPLVAEVDLGSGAVTYHDVHGGGRAASPVATAADRLSTGPYRIARWVGEGTIAVAGGTIRPKRGFRRLNARGRHAVRVKPDGLRLIRTADWSVTTLDLRLPWFTAAADALLAMGPVSSSEATGLAAYGSDGRHLFTRLRGTRHARVSGAAWPYAYVTAKRPRRTYVVDLRSGRTVNMIPSRRPPSLLVR